MLIELTRIRLRATLIPAKMLKDLLILLPFANFKLKREDSLMLLFLKFKSLNENIEDTAKIALEPREFLSE